MQYRMVLLQAAEPLALAVTTGNMPKACCCSISQAFHGPHLPSWFRLMSCTCASEAFCQKSDRIIMTVTHSVPTAIMRKMSHMTLMMAPATVALQRASHQ